MMSHEKEVSLEEKFDSSSFSLICFICPRGNAYRDAYPVVVVRCMTRSPTMLGSNWVSMLAS